MDKINSISFFACMKRFFHHLSNRRRWQLLGLLFGMLLGAAAEMATLGAVFPFLSVVADPTAALKFPILNNVFSVLGWKDAANILLPATTLFAIVAISAAIIRIFLSWMSFKFICGVGMDIGLKVYRNSLYQPYTFHVSHNTSEIIAGISKVDNLINGVLVPLMQLVIGIVLSLAILSALIKIDPFVALSAGLSFSIIYLVTSISIRRQLSINGQKIASEHINRVQVLQEGLGGIRDILIDGTQSIYANRFSESNIKLQSGQASNGFLSTAPKFLIESLSMILIAFLAYWLSKGEGGLAVAIPILGALALGAQKLLPQLQVIYAGWSAVAGNKRVLTDIFTLIERPIPTEYTALPPSRALTFNKEIHLNNISFSYGKDNQLAINTLNLNIKKGNWVGFVGKTGSGKSTVVDLIMGLLQATEGLIQVDDVSLTPENRRAWQLNIAHVPQFIYLNDSSIAENIAFGINKKDIDFDRIDYAAKSAQIADFIESMPNQYDSIIGERGVRLSGGQRQRIGIARALYKQANILILDEATSALDESTEKAVMKAIHNLGNNLTVIMIAHRVSTLKACDSIFEIENGALKRTINYDELIKTSS